jgi:hypothetical protein
MTSISRHLRFVAVTSALILFASAQLADAGVLRTTLTQPQPPMAAPVPMVDPSSASGVCCPPACIAYRHLGRVCKSLCCQPSVETVLSVKNPCTCCDVSIPVCLPACCLECAPDVSCRHGLFAQGIVSYDYACGVSVTVRFKHTGEILVTYRGV